MRCLVAILALLALARGAWADEFPSRTVRIVVPYPAGGATDITARAVSVELGKIWNQPVVVENKSGAIGVIGADAVAKSAPDGYTVMLSTQNEVAVNHLLSSKMPYDPMTAFKAVTLGTSSPQLLVVNPKLPIRTLSDLLSYAKDNPGKLSFASPGEGSTQHLAGALMSKIAGVDLLHVPYRGTAPALSDVIAGHASMMFAAIGPLLPYVQSGSLRAIAVTAAGRAANLPDVPTMAEAGLKDMVMLNWFGVFVPAATPDQVVNILNRDFVKALRSKDVSDAMQKQSLDVGAMSVDEFRQFWTAQIEEYRRVIQTVGLKPD